MNYLGEVLNLVEVFIFNFKVFIGIIIDFFSLSLSDLLDTIRNSNLSSTIKDVIVPSLAKIVEVIGLGDYSMFTLVVGGGLVFTVGYSFVKWLIGVLG